MVMQDRIPAGTRVILPDNTTATAYPDCGIGRPWDGRYRTVQPNPVTGGMRVDVGWQREQLTVIG